MAELLSGVLSGREYRDLGKSRDVSAPAILAGMLAYPGGRLEERFTADGTWRGYRYTCHGRLWFEW